ncbi:MAG TPA: LysR substrate-binding domain-containing protein, partial [Terriglobales bacterium]
ERTESLLSRLALRQLDVVVCDSPSNSMANVRVFSHKLASTGVAFMASPKLRLRGKFPQLLDGVPFLMAEANTPLRSALEYWLEKSGVQPKVVGEFSDAGLMESFAQDGAGVIAIPSPIEREMQARFKFAVLGRTTAVKQAFYAITADRNPSNPLLMAILKRGLR